MIREVPKRTLLTKIFCYQEECQVSHSCIFKYRRDTIVFQLKHCISSVCAMQVTMGIVEVAGAGTACIHV